MHNIAEKIIFTGELDRFYEFRFGQIQYRTVSFDFEKINCPNFQGNAVINYTDSASPYTRIIEHKHFEKFGSDVYSTPITIISKEYSKEWEAGDEPYYPINDEINNAIYQKYKELTLLEKDVVFCGRLAEYRYFDMHQVIENTLNTVNNLVKQ